MFIPSYIPRITSVFQHIVCYFSQYIYTPHTQRTLGCLHTYSITHVKAYILYRICSVSSCYDMHSCISVETVFILSNPIMISHQMHSITKKEGAFLLNHCETSMAVITLLAYNSSYINTSAFMVGIESFQILFRATLVFSQILYQQM